MRHTSRAGAALTAILLTLACTTAKPALAEHKRAAAHPAAAPVQWNHDWARGAVFYEVFVRSYLDANGDGNGDLNGLTSKLDYLKNDLHVDALWLMPVFQSPSYHGYDVTDYETIEKDYGTNADFQNFLQEAHKRGIRVILDFVMNHTSSEHPWFVDSASSTTSAHRDWYVWNATNPGWTQPWGGTYPTWYPLNGAYYYAVFWSGMPDLNWRNAGVKAEMFRVANEWLTQSVDGFRLDAARYLVEDGPGKGQADTPETHQVLRDFAADVRYVKPDAILVAENTVDTATLATYYGSTAVIAGGDEMPMNFNFPLAAAIVQGVNNGNAAGIRDVIKSVNALYPAGAIDAPFLTNHDQTRVATQLANDPGKLRDAAAILLTLPGAPFVYYGEEVGLQNGPTSADESKRTPMPWTPSGGFTTATPWFAYAPGTATENVASEIGDPSSLLSYYRNWIAARHGSSALMKGDILPLDSAPQVLAFTRNAPGESVLVVHNLGSTSVTAGPFALDTSALKVVYADAGVASPTVNSDAWTIALPPHSGIIYTDSTTQLNSGSHQREDVMTRSFPVRTFLRSVALLALSLVAAWPVAAQNLGRIEGRVTDASGAALPGVTVSAVNNNTNAVRTDVSDSKGLYAITALPVGPYTVRAELSGFKTQNVPVTLTVGQVARTDMKLELGNVSETLTVTAAAPVIDKTTSEIATVITAKQVEKLPLNGRNFTQLATLAPGVTRGIPGSNAAGGGGGTDAETFRYAEFGGAALSVNGLREQFNNFEIEGQDNNESLVNTIAYLPPPEAIQEFSVITTNAPAEYGRAAGAVQNLVIKSGTNQFHGSAYYFDRPKGLAATPHFATTKPDFNNRDFGVTLGGPIIKDQTFFFGSYHGLRNSIPVEAGNYVTVPTLKMRNGDFSELLSNDPNICIKDSSGNCRQVIIYNPQTGQPFPGNIIPPSMINPAGKAYLNAFPAPTTNAILHNYLTHRQKQSHYNDFDGKVDQKITAGDQLYGSASVWSDGFSDPGRIPGYQAGFGAGSSDNKGYETRLQETHVFSSNVVNEARAGFTDFRFEFLPVGYGTNQDAALGIAGIGGVTRDNGISLIGGGDGTYIEYLGDFGQYRINQRSWQGHDAITWLTGSHAFKFGGDLVRRSMFQERTQYGKGFYFFNDAFGFQPGFTGYEVSDMLAGTTIFTTSAEPGFVPRNTISWENGLYAQDDWHLRPNLTLNLGLRWDIFTPYYESNNQLANYDPVTQKLVIPDQNGATRSTLKTNWTNFGPRIGFNYLFNPKTTVRGGYGIFYALDRGGIDRQLTENPPAVVSDFRFGFGGCIPGSCVSLSQPIPLPDPVDPNNPNLPQGSGLVYIPYNSKNTRVQQWSLGIEREVFDRASLLVAWVGNRADHLAANITAAGFAGDVAGRLSTTMYIGQSTYNALQTSLRQTLFGGLSYLASYTYAHAMNNTVGFFPGNPSNGGSLATDTSCVAKGTQDCNLNLDRGPADYDVRHRFTFAGTWAIPWMQQNSVIGGWSLNAVYTLQTGTPFTVYDNSGKRADMNGNPNSGPHSTDQWFNTSVFSPAKGAQGTEPRNAVRGPGYKSLDMSIFKTFSIPQYGAIELRLEGFNILDTPQYNLPDQIVGDANFGKITTTRLNTERQIQLAARYFF